MYCKNCGNKLNSTDSFCSKCGKGIENKTTSNYKKNENISSKILPPEKEKIKCPKCKSIDIIHGKKGFSGRKAVAGVILTGGIGILAGTIGSNKIMFSCLSCGNNFKFGEDYKSINEKKKQSKHMVSTKKGKIFLAIFLAIMGYFLNYVGLPWWFTVVVIIVVLIKISFDSSTIDK